MIREAITYPLDTDEPIKTLLIGGFLLGTGSVLALVFVLGYLLRVLTTPPAEGSAPLFDRWWTLAYDGARTLAVWIVCAFAPLVVLLVWIELYVLAAASADPLSPVHRHVMNVVVHGLGIGVGGPIAARPLVQTAHDLAAIGGAFGAVVPMLSNLNIVTVVLALGVLYALLLLLSLYVTPIAFANFAHERTFRSAFDMNVIRNAATSSRYASRWCLAVVFLIVGALAPILWNEWRLLTGGTDWGLLHIGLIPIVAHPTPTGIQSVAFLFLASVVNFYLLVVGYALMGSALSSIVAETDARPAREPDDHESVDS